MFDALVLAPCDRSAIWLAKWLATFAFLAAAELVACRLRRLLPRSARRRSLAVVLADMGICAVGTFVGAMATQAGPVTCCCRCSFSRSRSRS